MHEYGLVLAMNVKIIFEKNLLATIILIKAYTKEKQFWYFLFKSHSHGVIV
jgi:hypothetical protein